MIIGLEEETLDTGLTPALLIASESLSGTISLSPDRILHGVVRLQ